MTSPTYSPVYVLSHVKVIFLDNLFLFSGSKCQCLLVLAFVLHKLLHHIKNIQTKQCLFFPFHSLIPFSLKDQFTYLYSILPRFTEFLLWEIIPLNSWDYSEVYKPSMKKESICSCYFQVWVTRRWYHLIETSQKKRLGGEKLNLAWDIRDLFLWARDISKWRNATCHWRETG